MLPIKRGYFNHYHDIAVKNQRNVEFDSTLFRCLYTSRRGQKYDGDYVTPIACIVGNRVSRHWVLVDADKMYYYYHHHDGSKSDALYRSPTLEGIIDQVPLKDKRGLVVRKYIAQQLRGEVAYGKFPFKPKLVTTAIPPLIADMPPAPLFRREITRAAQVPIVDYIETLIDDEDDIED
jgi:hypothetical protein